MAACLVRWVMGREISESGALKESGECAETLYLLEKAQDCSLDAWSLVLSLLGKEEEETVLLLPKDLTKENSSFLVFEFLRGALASGSIPAVANLAAD